MAGIPISTTERRLERLSETRQDELLLSVITGLTGNLSQALNDIAELRTRVDALEPGNFLVGGPGYAVGCTHEQFENNVNVIRLTEGNGYPLEYRAEVHVRCAGCKQPFRWKGLPMGLTDEVPTTSADGYELRAPLTDGR